MQWILQLYSNTLISPNNLLYDFGIGNKLEKCYRGCHLSCFLVCMRTHKSGGAKSVQLRTKGEGCKIFQKFCVRTKWMTP